MGDLLSVVIGGVLAIGGGAGTQWYLYRLKARGESRQRLASKFEEMVTLVYELDHWLGKSNERLLFGKENIETVTPYAKMRAITVVYFPHFYHLLTELNVISGDYQIWLIKKAKKRCEGEGIDDTGFEEIYKKFLDAQRKLLNELSSYVENELRSNKPLRLPLKSIIGRFLLRAPA